MLDMSCLTIVIMTPPKKTPAAAIRSSQGRRIKDFREFRDLSQDAVAKKIGVTKQAVSDWETGKSSPRQVHQVALAKTLNTPWSGLFSLDAQASS